MNPREEIGVIRTRLGALEFEFAELRAKLQWVEGLLRQQDAEAAKPAPDVAAQVVALPVLETPPEPISSFTEALVPPAAELLPETPLFAPPTSDATILPVVPEIPAEASIPFVVEPPPVLDEFTASAPKSTEFVPDFSKAPERIESDQPSFAAPEPTVNPLREWLEPLQLWPPQGEANAEVRLAAWWATRIGALFAVIGVVFLGAYVSQGSPPWVRLVEVIAVTCGVLGLGSWLERKLPKFGAVVFGAGLAMTYFTAFAAYAVPAMKVIQSPTAATACELFAVSAILAVAWRRNSIVVATIAVALGYVTAFLALRAGPLDFGPWVVLLLGVAAVVLRLAKNWDAPSFLAMPLTWIFLAAAVLRQDPALAFSLRAAWLWSALHFVLFISRDWLAALRGIELRTLDRALQVTSSSAAVVVGLMAALNAGGSATQTWFFGSGVVMLAAAWAWRRVGVTQLVPVFVCKGTGLLALGVIDALAGQARYLVLLAQAAVMLVSAAQSRQRWLRTATVLVGIVAVGFYLADLLKAGVPFAGARVVLQLAFLAGAVALVGALRRWTDWSEWRTAAGSAVVGLIAIFTVAEWPLHGWSPAGHVGVAIILVFAAVALRSGLSAGIAGGLVLVAGHAAIWLFDRATGSLAGLWWSEALLLAAAFAAAGAIRRIRDDATQQVLRGVIPLVAASTLVIAGFRGGSTTSGLALANVVAAALVVGGGWARRWPLAVLAAPAIVLGLLFWLWPVGSLLNGFDGDRRWLWLAMSAGWLVPIWWMGSAASRENAMPEVWRPWLPSVHTWLATGFTVLAVIMGVSFSLPQLRSGSLLLAAFVVGLLPWLARLRPALEASWALWGVTVLYMRGPAWGLLLAAGALVAWCHAVLLGRVPALAQLQASRLPWRRHSEAVQSLIAIVFTWLAIDVGLPHTSWWAGCVVVALVAFGLGWSRLLRWGLEISWVFWVAAVGYNLNHPADALNWLTVLLAWIPALVLAHESSGQALCANAPAWRRSAVGAQAVLATIFGWVTITDYHGAACLGAHGGMIVLTLGLWRWGRIVAARPAAVALSASLLITAFHVAGSGEARHWGLTTASTLAAAAWVSALPFVVGGELVGGQRKGLRWCGALSGLTLAFVTLALQRGQLVDYITVGWGVAALATFLAGLVVRSQPHRFCGLAGLSLCIIRAFAVDLHSTLHRIAAFVALGVLLLWVGFSYHRFRHLIVDDEKKL